MFVELFLSGAILFSTGPDLEWIIQLGGILLIFLATAYFSIPEHNRLVLGKKIRPPLSA
jgi:hypothetical protein